MDPKQPTAAERWEKGKPPVQCMRCNSTEGFTPDPAFTNARQLAHRCKACGHQHITGLPASVTGRKPKGE